MIRGGDDTNVCTRCGAATSLDRKRDMHSAGPKMGVIGTVHAYHQCSNFFEPVSMQSAGQALQDGAYEQHLV